MRGINLLLASACFLAPVMAQTKLRIILLVPLGDSITEITCWRTILWDHLTTAGVADKIQFVGTMTDNTQACIGTSTWDHHHEGHSGYLAIDVASTYLEGWLAAARPDVVMFMLGTNDVANGHNTSEILAAYTTMVQQMRASNPKMQIIIDLIIPLPLRSVEVMNLNAAIPAWAQSQNSTTSPIFIADCFTGFPASDLRDGVHPNDGGDQIIASRLYPIVLPIINQSMTSNSKGLVGNLLGGLLSLLGLS
ncbi:Multidomain esterase [Lachnellula suecica]|uniref:Multidomain esterase n=1 Tax=Lachnellula suecica TaxID=602035 RepID=A0A8T9C6Z5_9HELO|nr:Multidomain esterase [Lachnellula suecica]